MSRNIQASHVQNPGLKAFLGPLVAAVFWVVIAFRFPVERIPDWVPALAPYAQWMPPLFLVLALWAFLRSARSLIRIANSRHAQAPHIQAPRGGGLPGKPPGKRQPGQVGPKAAPTVQRMR